MIFDSDFFRGLFADLFTIGIYGQCTFYFPARDGYFVVDFSRSGGLEIEIETLVPQFAVGVFDVDLTAFGRFRARCHVHAFGGGDGYFSV